MVKGVLAERQVVQRLMVPQWEVQEALVAAVLAVRWPLLVGQPVVLLVVVVVQGEQEELVRVVVQQARLPAHSRVEVVMGTL